MASAGSSPSSPSPTGSTRTARPTRSAPARSSSRSGSRTTTSPPPRTLTTGGRGTPYLDSITYKPIPDPDQLLSSLTSGSVDIMHSNTPNAISTLRSGTSLGYVDDSTNVAGESDMGCLLLNLDKPPFNNLKVRQATAYAISSAQYVKVIDQGIFPTSNRPFSSNSPYYVADNGYPVYNVSKGKQLVQEAQQETGQPVSVTVKHVPDPTTTRIAEYLQGLLQV